MADYVVNENDLTSIADAIRTKGGTTASLSFPTGFVSAINAIPSGGTGETVTITCDDDPDAVYYIGVRDADDKMYVTSAPFPADFVSESVVVLETALENIVLEDENGNPVAEIYHLDGGTWVFAVPYVNCFIINAN